MWHGHKNWSEVTYSFFLLFQTKNESEKMIKHKYIFKFLSFLDSLGVRLIKKIWLVYQKKLFRWKSRTKDLTHLQKSQKFYDVWCSAGRYVHPNESAPRKHIFHLICRMSLAREILKFLYVKIKRSKNMPFLRLFFTNFKKFQKLKVRYFLVLLHIFTFYNLGSDFIPKNSHFNDFYFCNFLKLVGNSLKNGIFFNFFILTYRNFKISLARLILLIK